MMDHVTIRMQCHVCYNAETSAAIYRRMRFVNEETFAIQPIIQTYGIIECLSNFTRLVRCIRQILDIIRHCFGPNFMKINNNYFTVE